MKETERKIIEAAKTGDEEAFNQLYQTFYPLAYGLAMNYTKSDADAKDAVQECFISIHEGIGELREIDAFPAWLKMIVHSKCYKLFRKKYDVAMDLSQSLALNKEHRSYMNPQMNADYHSEQEVLYQLINHLKPRLQEVIKLVYLDQLKIEEVAHHLNISQSAVKTRIHRAKKELAQQIVLFEKQNQRKITFYQKGLGPVSIVAVTIAHMKQRIMQCHHLIRANALTSACALSLSVLAISGSVMAYMDLRRAIDQQSVGEHTIHAPIGEEVLLSKTSKPAFIPLSYGDTWIDNSRAAYFTCLNFALDKAEMQQHTIAEIEAILPLLEALKQRNDEYYHKLVSDGWEQLLMQEYAYRN